jgi:hypothetical protein
MTQPERIPQNLTDLSYPEQLTLWSIRYWSDAFRQKYSPYESLRQAYRLAKCPGGLLSLDSFMSLIIAGHSRPVDVRCPCCGGISMDEWRVLQSLALIQSGDNGSFSHLVSHFLEPAAIRNALPVLLEWAEDLSNQSLRLPVRPSILLAARQTYPVSSNRKAVDRSRVQHRTTLH